MKRVGNSNLEKYVHNHAAGADVQRFSSQQSINMRSMIITNGVVNRDLQNIFHQTRDMWRPLSLASKQWWTVRSKEFSQFEAIVFCC